MIKARTSRIVLLIIAIMLNFVNPILISDQAQAVGPGNVNTGLLLWLDASDPDNDGNSSNNPTSGTAVTSWSDKSGNSNNARILSGQGSPTYIPVSNINSIPAMRFVRTSDSSGQVFEVPNVDIRACNKPDVTIFAVYRASNAANGTLYGVWGQDNGNWDRFFISNGYPNNASDGVVGRGGSGYTISGSGNGTTRLVTVTYDGTTTNSGRCTTAPLATNSGPSNASKIYFDGAEVNQFQDVTNATDAQSTFRIGWDGDNSAFNGDIAEVIIYDRALPLSDVTTVSNYLADKYGITLAPTVTTNAATSITQTTATLNAVVNAHSDTTTTLTLKYATDSTTVSNGNGTSPTVSPTSVSGASDTNISASITGLTANTTYYYRVSATNSKGTNSGSIVSFTTSSDAVITSCAGAGSLTNGSFEDTGTISYLDGNYPLGWKTTAIASRNSSGQESGTLTKAKIELWENLPTDITDTSISGTGDGSAANGSVIVEIAADAGGDFDVANGIKQGIYQDVNTINGARIFWSYWHHARNLFSTNDQVSAFMAAPTPSGVPSGNVWTGTEQTSPFGSGVTPITTVYDTVTVSQAWHKSEGTFLATSSSTRFLFKNIVASSNASVGNLIDDVKFTTYVACPISVSTVAGRSSSYVVRNNEQNASDFKFYGPAGAVITSVSSITSGLTLSVSSVANTSSTFSISASNPGTYTANYQVSYTQNSVAYTTTSTISVTVKPEVQAKYPSYVPIDPTLTSKSLSGIKFTNATNAYVCFDQVADRNGTSISTPTINVSQGSVVANVYSISSGPPLIDSGTVSGLTSQLANISITPVSGVLGKGGSKYLRIRASSIDNTDGAAPSCANGISFVIEYRRIVVTHTRSFSVPLRNGHQSG